MSLLTRRAQDFTPISSDPVVEAWLKTQTMLLANQITPRSKDRGHTLFVGATGSGKSTLLEIYMKSILSHPPEELEVFNSFVADPQNDLHSSLMGMDLPVKVILTNVLDKRGWAWDMAKDVIDPAGAWQFAFAALPDEKDSNSNKFYNDAPRFIFAAVVRELVNRNLPWSLRLAFLLAMDDKYAEQLISTSTDPGVQMTSRLFKQEQGSTKANIDAALLTKLGNLQTYAALMEHASKKFSLAQLVKSDVLVLLGSDFQFHHVIQPMSYLFLTILKQKLLGQTKSDNRRHYVFMDEFAAVNHDKAADELLDLFVRGRSRGVRMTIVIHTPEQLVDIYGEHKAAVILGQCQNKICLRVDDVQGSEWCSKMLGSFHDFEWTQSINNGVTYSSQNSSTWGITGSEHYSDRPLVHPDEIRSLPLASLEDGFEGFGIIPGAYGVDRFRFRLSPEWLADHVVPRDKSIASYESSRRPGHQQKLTRLSRTEVENMGLTFNPNSSTDFDYPTPRGQR